MSNPKKILRSGVHERRELPPEDNPAYCQLRFAQAGNLTTLALEYKLFTHGLLFTHGGWDRDPISDYLVEWGPEFAPLVIDMPSRVIHGMECKDERGRQRADWCYKLLAVRHEGWDELFAFMSTVGAIHRDSGYLAKLLAQVVPVPDILAISRLTSISACPMVDVVIFGIDGNRRAVYVEPARSPPLDKPKVRSSPPDPETVELAEKILSGDPEPYKSIDVKFMELKTAKAETAIAATTKLLVG